MALKAGPFQGCARTSSLLVAISDSGSGCARNSLNWRNDFVRLRKWESCRMEVLAQRAITPVEGEKPGVDSSQTINRTPDKEPRGSRKDLSILPMIFLGAKFPLRSVLDRLIVLLSYFQVFLHLFFSPKLILEHYTNNSEPLSATDLHSPNDGSKVRVAYQGLPGAYSEIAAMKAYPKCETVPCDDFEAAFKAVELWLVEKAVLPIENSVGGSIHRNYDLLLRHRLHIAGEVQLQVNHCLLALQGVRKEELKNVLSHPHALDQCETSLSALGVLRISSEDTAMAAQMVASSGKRDTGAIASARAAEIYGLDILAENVQDDDNNITRFLILSREPVIPGTDKLYKTSIVFTLEEGPGVLFKALAVFSLREINLTKIESRPQRQRPLRVVDDSNEGRAKYFDYLFYIDFEASMMDPRAQCAMAHLQEFARFLRVLGCYPVDIV